MPFPVPNRGPLEGLVVLDFTTQLSGPLATYFLAGLGATVIKIEELKGDSVRGYAPFANPDGTVTMTREHPGAMSLPVLNRNRGKHSITLNLKAPEAMTIYRALVSRADIVVENYADGTADRLGIGFDATRAVNPRIIYCSLNGFGVGAEPGRKALDAVIQAMSGMMMASGKEGEPPVRIGVPIADAVAPLFAVMGINAAVYRRERTGQGEHIDVSMLGALTALLAVEDWQAMSGLGMPTRTGNTLVRAAPFGVFRCRDGHIAIGAGGRDHFVHSLFRLMDKPEMVADPRYATTAARIPREAELVQMVNAWCNDRAVEDVERQLVAAGISAAKVREPAAALDDPSLNDRRDVMAVTHPDFGVLPGLKTIGLPTRLRTSDYGHGAPAPRLGQHNEAIYRDWLGFDDARLAAWKAKGVI
ncbi:CaiB/BaiF CoA-transferase family protein [Reyranella sp. CPCC 100927]|uniref:CaiB/BaiF CoA transferase family protein n=1 Tax=Reyranella sp. CPCC 100927 TaxID=2599616 RepID=UPI0011B77DBF|nr:CoA transferase [Reyranella sp. CPCC 100927]TWT00687.1 CoA transferase [Reyranella sp. CPCC 100927]